MGLGSTSNIVLLCLYRPAGLPPPYVEACSFELGLEDLNGPWS